MKHSTQYLYGCEPERFAYMEYQHALIYKSNRAEMLMDELRIEAEPLDKLSSKYKAIVKHYKHVEKAKDFNQQLLDEIKGI